MKYNEKKNEKKGWKLSSKCDDEKALDISSEIKSISLWSEKKNVSGGFVIRWSLINQFLLHPNFIESEIT